MAARNTPRAAREALAEILRAESRWDGWNGDAVKVANDLANLLLQQHSAQQPGVWHPSLAYLFPDLPDKFATANLSTAKTLFAKLQEHLKKMDNQCASMETATTTLADLAQQNTGAESPLLFGTLLSYAELARTAAGVYREATAVRREYTTDYEKAIRCFEGSPSAPPPGVLDSDVQLVRLLTWQEMPGLKDTRLTKADACKIITLADFDDLVRGETERYL